MTLTPRPALAFALLACLLLGAFSAAGCTLVQPGDTIVRHEKGEPAAAIRAPESGTYTLFSSTDTTARLTVNLMQGAQLGFVRDGQGRLNAVAGDQQFELEADSYRWRRKR